MIFSCFLKTVHTIVFMKIKKKELERLIEEEKILLRKRALVETVNDQLVFVTCTNPKLRLQKRQANTHSRK
jgi:hypothetical protein